MRLFLFLSLIINYFGVPLHTVPSLAQGRPNTPIELSPQVGAGGLLVAIQDGTSHRRAVAYSLRTLLTALERMFVIVACW